MNIGVIFAGGAGTRMNTKSRPKQFLELNGKPILIYTLEIFDNHPEIDGIVVVCIESWIPFLMKMLKKFEINKVIKVIPGGKTGQESIYQGLCEAEAYALAKNDENTLTDNINKVKEKGSAITIIPATETIIIDKQDGTLDIPKRSMSMIARAPQSFYLKDIISAHRKSIEDNIEFIDSCSMMSYYGYTMGLVEGPMENIKITTPTDFYVLRAMVEVHENQQIFGFF